MFSPNRTEKDKGVFNTYAAAVARDFLKNILGWDFLEKASKGQLTYEDGGDLTDFRAYTKEQAEIVKHAYKQLESILEDVADINKHLAEIIKLGLKTKAEVNKYIKDVLVAGEKYSADSKVLASDLNHDKMVIGAESTSSIALSAARTRRKLLLAKFKHNQSLNQIEANYQAATQLDTEKQERDAERDRRRTLLSKGAGNPTRTNQSRKGGGWFGWLGRVAG